MFTWNYLTVETDQDSWIFLYLAPHQLLFANFPSQNMQIVKARMHLTFKNEEPTLQIGHLGSLCSFRTNSVTVFPEGTAPQFKMRYQRQHLGFLQTVRWERTDKTLWFADCQRDEKSHLEKMAVQPQTSTQAESKNLSLLSPMHI